MKEITPRQIAMAAMGHPFNGVTELRLLRLFQAEPSETTVVDAIEEATPSESIALAA